MIKKKKRDEKIMVGKEEVNHENVSLLFLYSGRQPTGKYVIHVCTMNRFKIGSLN